MNNDVKGAIDRAILGVVITGKETRRLDKLFDVLNKTPEESHLDNYTLIGGELANIIGRKIQTQDLMLQEKASTQYADTREKLKGVIADAILGLHPERIETVRDEAEVFVKQFEAFWNEELSRFSGRGRG